MHRSSLDNRLAALALKLESSDRRWRSTHISLLLFLGFSGISTVLVLGGHVGSEPLVLLLDLRESPHVLKEVLAALQGDEELGLLAALGALVLALTLARDRDGHRANRLELGVLVPDKVLGGDDAGGDGVAERVQLDGLMDLEVALAEEHVEVRVLLDRDVDLARVFGARARWLLLVVLLLGGFVHLTLCGLSFHTL